MVAQPTLELLTILQNLYMILLLVLKTRFRTFPLGIEPATFIVIFSTRISV